MNGLLSMIGMQTELDYLMGDFAACFGGTPLAIPKGNIPSDKQKCQPKEQHEFTIKGVKIMAALKIKNANYVVLEFTEDGIYTYINENTMLFTIKYIHELQHLLFGLGLNSEMEV